MYISWNNFNVGGGALFVTYSSDNGTTWHTPISVAPTFIRDVQITGDKITGDVYIAGMDEMGGGLTNRANKIYPLDRRRQHLDQHLHRSHLPWTRA